ncbi:APC family permease [Arthrobacter sp. I2-34]|uniref:APC family permease n=1 Tax=Arthrobacter hankyongi TaxID=2904801 RepID=A0ABS9L595_9MICC|nr:APC family permease [Arthrobacter hankyongi]MCG2621834.1 APC family permease [Arthrobacter hankyongi]
MATTKNAPSLEGGKHGTQLTGRMGVMSLMLTVLAFSAPLAVVTGYIPVAIIFGGNGTSVAFVIATVILLIFSAGYVAMSKRVDRPGAFYTFVSRGLGKPAGLGTAYLAIISYLLVLVGTYAFIGVVAAGLIQSVGGPAIPWWISAVVSWAAVSTLGYFNIELSAKVLSVVMVLEVLVILIFNAFTLAQGGAEGLSVTPLLPSEFIKGDIGVTMLFAFMVFMGFEATALFREEVRHPNVTIPRATYGAVLFVGVLYALTCYGLIAAYGSDAVDVATNETTDMFANAAGHFVGGIFVQITLIMALTSSFAANVSIHNVIARYTYNLGYDHALPRSLARVHHSHASPHVASNAAAAVAGLLIAIIAVLPIDESILYAQLVAIGTVGVLGLMALVSVAIIAWFATRRSSNSEGIFKIYVAPAISAVSLLFVVVMATVNFHLVAGGEPGQYTWLLIPLPLALLAGIYIALRLRRSNPSRYARLGRDEVDPFHNHTAESLTEAD